MNVERILKTISMDPSCNARCNAKQIYDFGRNCDRQCRKNMQKTLTPSERQVIIMSMMYCKALKTSDLLTYKSDKFRSEIDGGSSDPNARLHPDLREILWLRASGSYQLMLTYDSYPNKKRPADKKDYFTALLESPNVPNPSTSKILADKNKIRFDMDEE